MDNEMPNYYVLRHGYVLYHPSTGTIMPVASDSEVVLIPIDLMSLNEQAYMYEVGSIPSRTIMRLAVSLRGILKDWEDEYVDPWADSDNSDRSESYAQDK